MEHNTKSYRPCIYSQRKKSEVKGGCSLEYISWDLYKFSPPEQEWWKKSRGGQAVKCCKNTSKPNAWKRKGVWANLKLDSLILTAYCGQGVGGGVQGDRNILNFNSFRIWSLESTWEGFKITRGCYKLEQLKNNETLSGTDFLSHSGQDSVLVANKRATGSSVHSVSPSPHIWGQSMETN